MRFELVHILFLFLCGLSALVLFLLTLTARERRKLKAMSGLVSTITETTGSFCWEWHASIGRFSLVPSGTSIFGRDIQTCGDLIALMHPDDVRAFEKTLEGFTGCGGSANRRAAESVEFRMQSVMGNWKWFVIRRSAADFSLNSANKAVTVRGAMQDIDAYKTLMEAMRSSEKRIAAIFKSAPGSMAVTDKNGGLIEANRAFYDMLGYSPDALQGVPIMSLSSVPYGQDSASTMANVLKKFEDHDGSPYRSYIEEDFVRSGGQLITVDYGLSAILDFDGNVTNYVFSGVNITQQKERAAELKLLTENQIAHSNQLEQLHGLVHSLLRSQDLEHLLEGMIGYLKKVVPNSACSIYLFYGANGQEGEKLKRLAWYDGEGISAPDGSQVLTAITRGVPFVEEGKNGLETRRILPLSFQSRSIGAVDLCKPSGMTPEELKLYQLLADYMSSFWMLYDLLTEREEEALHDALTGIWNRRYMNSRLLEENERIIRYGGNACLVIGDMGNFKNVNDDYGHAKGDEVLVKTADTIKKNLRLSDCVGRYGGDEFIIVLSNVAEKDAHIIIERIGCELARLDIRGDDSNPDSPRIPVVIDFGLAFFPGGAPSLPETVALADEAMYASKTERKKRLNIDQRRI